MQYSVLKLLAFLLAAHVGYTFHMGYRRACDIGLGSPYTMTNTIARGSISMKSSTPPSIVPEKKNKWWKSAILSLGLLTASVGTNPAESLAADTVKVGKCLLKSCQKELAQCVLNPKCAANILCLNSCNGRKDEANCQIKCGDYFENDVVGVFNACAVSQKRCVPQKQNEGEYPLPAKASQVKKFDTSIWNGRWYISAGLNKVFDTFDCQVHFFTSPKPGTFYAKLFWRVNEPDGEFFTKNAVQKFVVDPENPAHFLNHDNEYLHYKDDWYILDYDKEFVLVYYMGSNDAWDGYGGAFLYTRSPIVNPKIIPRLEKAMDKAGLKWKWSDFTMTDNSCSIQREDTTALRSQYAKKVLLTQEEALQQELVTLRNAAVNTIISDEEVAVNSLFKLEKELVKFEQEILKDVGGIEQELESLVKGSK
jgi:violaxanthin de-epoxidase